MATTTIQDFVDAIATKADIYLPKRKRPLDHLSAIQQEGDAAKVGQLLNQIPGAADLAQKHVVVVGSGVACLALLAVSRQGQ